MAGVLFVLCIPTEIGENKFYNRTNINDEDTSPTRPIKEIPSSKCKQFGDAQNQSEVFIDIEESQCRELGTTRKVPRSEPISIDSIGSASPFTDQSKQAQSQNNIELHQNETPKFLSTVDDLESNKLRKSWDGYLRDLMNSAKRMDHRTVASDTLNLSDDASMECVVKAILKKMHVKSAHWQRSELGDVHQIMFSVESGYAHEKILTLLNEWGIGEREGSSVSIIPCTLLHKPIPEIDAVGITAQDAMNKTEGSWNRFMNSMRARLNVAQIVEEVKQNATITFDFLTLLIIAGVLAAFGLVEDSTIFLASSMLISPLMGPIIAATFGTVIKDQELTKIGIVNELIGIFITTVVGFFFGLIMCTMDERYGIGEGLTEEMLSRCEIHSLIVGICIAIPSGAAVAISILSENTGSLVGVAISASLLPPAVNSGVLWALAVIFIFHEQDETQYNRVIKTNDWSDHQAIELAVMGCISMTVTITNVICVYATGTLFLKIKEVAPLVSRNQRQFWKHDVKVARDFNNKSAAQNGGDGGSLLTQKLADEFAEFQENDPELLGGTANLGRNKTLGHPVHQNTWSPMTFHSNDLSVQEMEDIYLNLAHPLHGNTRPVRHFHRVGPGSSKTVSLKRSSPPKYRSVLSDQIFGSHRRSSVPHYSSSLGSETPHYRRFSKSDGDHFTMAACLQNIPEVRPPKKISDIVNDSPALGIPINVEIEHQSSSGLRRKFVVSPAITDPLYTHFK